MACGCNTIVSGLSIGCDNKSSGGILEIYITPKCNVASLTLGSPSDEITTITMESGKLFYKYEFNKNSSTYTEVGTVDPAVGSQTVTQTVTLFFSKREKSKRDKFALFFGVNLVAIVKDANGILHYLGELNGLSLTELNSENGTVRSDKNGYTLTLVAEEQDLANTVTDAALAAVI